MGVLGAFGFLSLVLGLFLFKYWIISVPIGDRAPFFADKPVLHLLVGLSGFLLALFGAGCIVACIIKLF
jgi:hypothetical protein